MALTPLTQLGLIRGQGKEKLTNGEATVNCHRIKILLISSAFLVLAIFTASCDSKRSEKKPPVFKPAHKEGAFFSRPSNSIFRLRLSALLDHSEAETKVNFFGVLEWDSDLKCVVFAKDELWIKTELDNKLGGSSGLPPTIGFPGSETVFVTSSKIEHVGDFDFVQAEIDISYHGIGTPKDMKSDSIVSDVYRVQRQRGRESRCGRQDSVVLTPVPYGDPEVIWLD